MPLRPAPILLANHECTPPLLAGYLFQSPAWSRCRLQQVLLTQVFRQADRLFAALLDDIRYGRNARAALQRIAATCRRPLE